MQVGKISMIQKNNSVRLDKQDYKEGKEFESFMRDACLRHSVPIYSFRWRKMYGCKD